MATTLKARKGIATRQAKALNDLLETYNHLTKGSFPNDQCDTENLISQINNALVHIRATQTSFEKAFFAFAEAVDKLQHSLENEEEERISEQLEKGQVLLSESEDLQARLEVEKQALDSGKVWHSTMTRAELPKTPIPEFSGNCWEWDNFWELFNATIHSTPLSDLQKFNYLLQALKGEARQSAERYQITSKNYPMVVKHLQEKYGNTSVIITNLHEQMEVCTAQSTELKDQCKLFDRLSSITRQLESKGEDLNSPWLMSKTLAKFRDDIKRKVLEKKVTQSYNETWTMTKQMDVLDTVLKQEEEIERHMSKTFKPQNTQERRYISRGSPAPTYAKTRSPYCFFCNSQDHWSISCTKLKHPKERIEYLKQTKRCLGCGSRNHAFSECKGVGCTHCGKRHHTSICLKNTEPNFPTTQAEQKNNGKPKNSLQNFTSNEPQIEAGANDADISAVAENPKATVKGDICLLTGSIKVMNPVTERLRDVLVLLDTGADRSFIDFELAQELQLPRQGSSTMRLSTFGTTQQRDITCPITSLSIWDNEGVQHTLQLYIHDTITPNVSRPALDKRDINFIKRKHIRLCSPMKKSHIQARILIGCDQLWNFIKFGSPHFTLPSGLRLIPTTFGYMISGQKLSQNGTITKGNPVLVHTSKTSDPMDFWEQYWSTESCEREEELSRTEKEEKANTNAQILKEFNNTIQKRDDGYYVKLPFKEQYSELPDNRALSWKRLKNTLRKYSDHPDILLQYDNVFKEQLKAGILEEVNESEDSSTTRKHYLPHQLVITPQKTTTKFRVVFDASAHYRNCPSLNDMIHQGPTMLPKLYGILLRFRTGRYVLLSDVEKAFLQVRLQESDRDFTRCLWVKNVKEALTHENIAVYRFTRVTFGINASPFLLSATILYHLKNYVKNEELTDEIARNLYVDNLFVNADSREGAIQKYTDLKTIFSNMRMNLREFIANDAYIMDAIKVCDQSLSRVPKVLGVPWNSITDHFELKINIDEKNFVSKRVVAQQLASIYDPLGWFIPLLVKAKHFQQQLWKHHYEWDEPLIPKDAEKWLQLMQGINGFQHQLPRMIANVKTEYTLVTYTDASSIAMTACIYIVNETSSYLLMAKSKIPHMKYQATIPKLELNALAIGVRLTSNVFQSMNPSINVKNILILTDSEIALHWISTPKYRGNGVFVTNRVKEIHEIVQNLESLKLSVKFGYIDSSKNPADCGTRGLSKENFGSHVWWHAYSLQQISSEGMGKNLHSLQTSEYEEFPSEACLHIAQSSQVEITDVMDLEAFSNFTRAKRILAYALRFLKKLTCHLHSGLKQKLFDSLPWLEHQTQEDYLSALDILDAQHVLVRNHQLTHINAHYKKELTKNLNTKEDRVKILRAYGRLNKSDLDPTAKNPILIAPNTHLARLIINDAHGPYHVGTAHTISNVRRMYWIPRLREQVKKSLRKCITCQKMNNLPFKYPEMTDLPRSRVTRSRVFQHTGLDYFGPLTVFREDREKISVYGCIFTCTVTRMIHLELVLYGTTEKFLNAFRRFVARRGKPQTVICDNAPTFLLGSQILDQSLRKIEEEPSINEAMSNHCITWHHITPFSPWKGGFYERLIKSVKSSLFKAIGRRILNIDQLTTLLHEIEACLNTRPLTYQETDLEDFIRSIRPIDFIQHEMDVTLPLDNLSDDDDDPTYLPTAEIGRFKTRIQTQKALRSSYQLTERYWNIWKNSYLSALREQHRRNVTNQRGSAKQPVEGEIVLIVDTYQKRNNWKLGRISRLIRNSDNEAREAEVYCGNNNYIRRPMNLLIPLEIGFDQENTKERRHTEVQHQDEERETDQPKSTRYDLRPRKEVGRNKSDL
uniref:Peptidase A2 domain-containing protein n=1 Tax=Haemonchus contortus TaxID=6289 RepID=A0A7I4YZT0_HAECO